MKQLKLVNKGKHPIIVERTVAGDLKSYRLDPNKPKFVGDKVAKLFLAKAPDEVEFAEDFELVDAHKLQDTRVILANVTGHPKFNPKRIEYLPVKGRPGQQEPVEYENEKCHPHRLMWRYNMGQDIVTEPSGRSNIYYKPNAKVFLAPHERRPFEKDMANWILNRDRGASKGMRGAVIKSRVKSEFEPDMSWDYEDMQLYASLLHVDFRKDEGRLLGPTVEALRERTENKEDLDEEIIAAKETLFTRALWYYLVDPSIPLVSYNAFELRRDKKGAVTDRRRGVKPKSQTQPSA